jgi:hypothetical protein
VAYTRPSGLVGDLMPDPGALFDQDVFPNRHFLHDDPRCLSKWLFRGIYGLFGGSGNEVNFYGNPGS